MSKKAKNTGLIEAKINNAIDRVTDTAVEKVKEKVDDKAPEFIGKIVDEALDSVKDGALDKAKTEIVAVAVKSSKKIVKTVIRRSITVAAVAGCTALVIKQRKAITGFVKGLIG